MAPSAAEPPRFRPADAPLSVVLKRVPDGRLILIAANRGAKTLDVTFVLPAGAAAGSVPVLNEDRILMRTGGELRDRFELYAVHIYALSRATERTAK